MARNIAETSCLNKKLNNEELVQVFANNNFSECINLVREKGLTGKDLMDITELELISWKLLPSTRKRLWSCIKKLKENQDDFTSNHQETKSVPSESLTKNMIKVEDVLIKNSAKRPQYLPMNPVNKSCLLARKIKIDKGKTLSPDNEKTKTTELLPVQDGQDYENSQQYENCKNDEPETARPVSNKNNQARPSLPKKPPRKLKPSQQKNEDINFTVPANFIKSFDLSPKKIEENDDEAVYELPPATTERKDNDKQSKNPTTVVARVNYENVELKNRSSSLFLCFFKKNIKEGGSSGIGKRPLPPLPKDVKEEKQDKPKTKQRSQSKNPDKINEEKIQTFVKIEKLEKQTKKKSPKKNKEENPIEQNEGTMGYNNQSFNTADEIKTNVPLPKPPAQLLSFHENLEYFVDYDKTVCRRLMRAHQVPTLRNRSNIIVEILLDNPSNEPFYKETDRKGAREYLTNLEDGAFLFRPSKRFFLTMTIKFKDTHFHLGIIRNERNKFVCDSNGANPPEFDDLTELINFFQKKPLTFRYDSNTIVDVCLKCSLPNVYQ